MSGPFIAGDVSRIGSKTDDMLAALPLSPHSRTLAGIEISVEALRLLPIDFVKRHRVLPFKLTGGSIHIATEQRGNQRVIEDIRLLTGLEVEEIEVPSAEVLSKIAECYQV